MGVFHTSYRLFLSPLGLSVTTVTLGSRLFLILLQINWTMDNTQQLVVKLEVLCAVAQASAA
jgi:hypothetical protein